MTAPEPMPADAAAARRKFPWMKTILIVSLALNLLFVGAAASRYFTHGPPDRVTGISQMQLVPRRFFGELDRQRRTELLSVFKGFRGDFRDGRKRARDEMARLAAALEAQPYDPAAVKAVVDGFSEVSAGLIRQGSDAAVVFIGKLTAEERLLLARHIRLRDDGGHRRKGQPDGED